MRKKKPGATVRELLDFSKQSDNDLNILLISKKHILTRHMTNNEINRPGMSLFGFYEHFAWERLQVFGRGESAYLEKLHKEKNLDSIRLFFEHDLPALIFANGYKPPPQIFELAEDRQIPILVSDLTTTKITIRLQEFFNRYLAPKEILHGVLMEIFGMGALLIGKHSVGKSECALELIERGHLFIADDVVDIRLVENYYLLGTGSKLIAHHMEVKGIGIINVAHLFGVGSIRNEKKIDMVIVLEPHQKDKQYDRVGIESKYKEILGVKVPQVTIPIQPGTNIPILVETAAKNERLKKIGYNPAKEFTKKLTHMLDQGIDII